LAEHGHGPEWREVFHVSVEDVELVEAALLSAVRTAEVESTRPALEGTNCRVVLQLAIHGRGAAVVSVWNVGEDRPPHLVTAYPQPLPSKEKP
jgi:hypothetical protein